jgi:hypothetical protein
MRDLWHGDGIFQCRGCGRIYAEYVNGCPDPVPHDDRKVVLVVPVPVGGDDEEPR